VVGSVGYDGVGVCGLPVYGYVDVGVVSVDGDIQKVNFAQQQNCKMVKKLQNALNT
jgi:hypothetical protein